MLLPWDVVVSPGAFWEAEVWAAGVEDGVVSTLGVVSAAAVVVSAGAWLVVGAAEGVVSTAGSEVVGAAFVEGAGAAEEAGGLAVLSSCRTCRAGLLLLMAVAWTAAAKPRATKRKWMRRREYMLVVVGVVIVRGRKTKFFPNERCRAMKSDRIGLCFSMEGVETRARRGYCCLAVAGDKVGRRLTSRVIQEVVR